MPGKLVSDIWDKEQADKICSAFQMADETPERSVIEEFCKRLEIDYEPVSELNNSSSVSSAMPGCFHRACVKC